MSNPIPEAAAPLVIVVKDGRWDAYGPRTDRSIFLMGILQTHGGINESVPPGLYHFNAVQTAEGLELSLNAFDDSST